MGLVPATSIGLGAMLGAGIFIFPGIAGGYAGMAATLSFLIGGVIALLVASCTAELSTAMPQSGGGYLFISRSFGPFWGTLTGIAQWIGLVFACSFYLVSFGEYASTLLEELHIQWSPGTRLFSFAFTLLLLIINIIGTRRVGQVQNVMVISLTVMLAGIFTYGLIDVFGLGERSTAVSKFAPEGAMPVFTTAALVFTSYLGFVQIANIGGEIRDPARNLPRSLIGSVVMAIGLYLFIMFVCSNIMTHEELGKYGETATIEVARIMLGKWGAMVVLFAGLLAALSSANASMISSSRSIFALSKDTLISKRASRINQRFGTPHIALILVAVPIGIMLFRSRLELFAEVASFLHLLIYSGICLSLFKFRIRPERWYVPVFRVPAGKFIAGFGAVSCLALISFMQWASILTGLGIMVFAAIYHLAFVRKRKVRLSLPNPPHFDIEISTPRVLIPVDIDREKKDLPGAILQTLPISSLLVLGYKEIPEQTDVEQAEQEYEESGKEKLENITRRLEETRIEYDQDLVFSDKPSDSIRQAIEEENLRLILTLKPQSELNRIMVPLYDLRQVNTSFATIIFELQRSGPFDLVAFLFSGEEKEAADEMRFRNEMNNRLGMLDVKIDRYEKVEAAPDDLMEGLKNVATETDIVVWSEADPEQRGRCYRMIRESEDFPAPVLMVLRQGDGQ